MRQQDESLPSSLNRSLSVKFNLLQTVPMIQEFR